MELKLGIHVLADRGFTLIYDGYILYIAVRIIATAAFCNPEDRVRVVIPSEVGGWASDFVIVLIWTNVFCKTKKFANCLIIFNYKIKARLDPSTGESL